MTDLEKLKIKVAELETRLEILERRADDIPTPISEEEHAAIIDSISDNYGSGE